MSLKPAHEKSGCRHYREAKARHDGHDFIEVDPVPVARALHIFFRVAKLKNWMTSICTYFLWYYTIPDRGRINSILIIVFKEKVVFEIVKPIF